MSPLYGPLKQVELGSGRTYAVLQMEGTRVDWITAANVNSLGLALDIFGVILLFRFGLPPSVDRGGTLYIVQEGQDEAEKRKAERYDRWSYVALGLLVLGFILQGLSNYMGSGYSEQGGLARAHVASPARENGGLIRIQHTAA